MRVIKEEKILKKWFEISSHNDNREIGKAYTEMRELLEELGEEKIDDYLEKLDSWWEEQVEETEQDFDGSSFTEVLGKMEKYNKIVRTMYEKLFMFTKDRVRANMEGEKL